MGGLGYKGGNHPVDPQPKEEKPPTPPFRKPAKKRISKRTQELKTLTNTRLRRMEIELAKEQAGDIRDRELNSATIAGQLLAQNMTPNNGGKPDLIRSHPHFRQIETELILTRGADLEDTCKRWGIVGKGGALAVKELAKYYFRMRRGYSHLFEVLDQATREKMQQSFLEKVDDMHSLARKAHVQAMDQKQIVTDKKGNVHTVDSPNYGAARDMLDKMSDAINLLGAAMDRQDKKSTPVPVSAQNGMPMTPVQINAPVGKIQIMAMPKAIKPKPTPPVAELKSLNPASNE